MEYIRSDGTRIIVNGDKIQYGDGVIKKNVIGANFTNGTIHGGYLSSFNGSFTDELIGIETGLGDIVNARIGDIKDAYELLKLKISDIDSNDIFELSRVVLETVNEYFNGFSNIDSRMNYYHTLDYDESENNKISNLKGAGAAMCVERSALSQNLLKSLGINSFFKTSGILKNGNREVHSYNLIEFNNRYYIFDSSMPNLIDDKINPLVAEIDKDTFTLLSSPLSDFGISTTVSHYNPYKDINITITYDSGRTRQVEFNSLSDSYNNLTSMVDEYSDNKIEVKDNIDHEQYIKSSNNQIGAISFFSNGLSLLIITILIIVIIILNLLFK